jgi:hypothetical protein
MAPDANKLWTADRILKHGGDTNKTCSLCHTHDKTALHMVAPCPFSNVVWHGLRDWIGLELQRPPTANYRKLKIWWSKMVLSSDGDAQVRTQKIIYTIWNIWKERCRRVYGNTALTKVQLQEAIRADVDKWRRAWRLSYPGS